MPKRFGDDSTIHAGSSVVLNGMKQIWAVLVEACDELGEVHWDWQVLTARWARPVSGGKGGQESHRSRQAWYQEEPACR